MSPASSPETPTQRSRDWSGRVIALISLVVALTGLGYNTWRNEATEVHRNTRQASFALLDQHGQLQQIVDNRYYAGERSEMTRIAAWSKAALIRGMGTLVSPATQDRAQAAMQMASTHTTRRRRRRSAIRSANCVVRCWQTCSDCAESQRLPDQT